MITEAKRKIGAAASGLAMLVTGAVATLPASDAEAQPRPKAHVRDQAYHYKGLKRLEATTTHNRTKTICLNVPVGMTEAQRLYQIAVNVTAIGKYDHNKAPVDLESRFKDDLKTKIKRERKKMKTGIPHSHLSAKARMTVYQVMSLGRLGSQQMEVANALISDLADAINVFANWSKPHCSGYRAFIAAAEEIGETSYAHFLEVPGLENLNDVAVRANAANCGKLVRARDSNSTGKSGYDLEVVPP